MHFKIKVKRMKFGKIFLFFLAVLVGLTAVIWLFLRVGIDNIINVLVIFSWQQFFLVVLISAIIVFIQIKKWEMIIRPFQYQTSRKKILMAFLGAQAITIITPIMYVGGEGVKALLLKEGSGRKSFIQTFGLIIVDRLAEGFALLTFFLLGGVLVIFYRYFTFGLIIIFLSLFVFIFIFLAIKAPAFFVFLIKFLGFKKFIEGKEEAKKEVNLMESFMTHHRRPFFVNIIFSFIILALSTFQIYLILLFLGQAVPVSDVYFIRLITFLGSLIPTPGSVGGFEGSVVFIFSILRVPLQLGLAMALVVRGVQFLIVVAGLILIFPYLTTVVLPTLLKNNYNNNNKNNIGSG